MDTQRMSNADMIQYCNEALAWDDFGPIDTLFFETVKRILLGEISPIEEEQDPDDIFAKTGRLLTQVIGDSYFNTAVFPGSAELRDQSGGILTKVFSKEGADDAFITTAFAEAINTAKTKFR